jgi:hypothetical protein
MPFLSSLTEIVAQQPAQALAALDWAFARERVKLGPDNLVLQALMVSLLVIMKEKT